MDQDIQILRVGVVQTDNFRKDRRFRVKFGKTVTIRHNIIRVKFNIKRLIMTSTKKKKKKFKNR